MAKERRACLACGGELEGYKERKDDIYHTCPACHEKDLLGKVIQDSATRRVKRSIRQFAEFNQGGGRGRVAMHAAGLRRPGAPQAKEVE